MENDIGLLALNFFVAIIPAVLLCMYIYFKDVVEKEPLKLLFSLFFLGIVITIPVFFIEDFLIKTFELNQATHLKIFVLAFFVISLTEEGLKYLITFLGVWKNKKFNYIYDGIVYASFTSLGFALFENLLYVMSNGTQVGLIRAVISVPAHGFFSIISGYYLGMAKFNKFIGYKKYKRRYLFLSFFLPFFLHGLFDYLLFLKDKNFLILFYFLIVAMYVVSFLLIRKVSKTQMTTPIE